MENVMLCKSQGPWHSLEFLCKSQPRLLLLWENLWADHEYSHVLTNLISFLSTSSQIKWQSASKCFVRSCRLGCWLLLVTGLLSQCRPFFSSPNSCNKISSHSYSQLPCAISQYSASALNWATTTCFLLFQETRLPQQVYNTLYWPSICFRSGSIRILLGLYI